jgi:glycosyltransferase involved in cell wall biosynthesis
VRIGIDYTSAVWQGAGIGRYTRELARAIIERSPQHSYRLFYASLNLPNGGVLLDSLRALCATYPHVRACPIPLPDRRLTQLWHRLRVPLPVELFTGPLDLLHAPDFVPAPSFAPTIVTIHDLSFKVHPECALPSVARYLNEAVPRGLKRAHAVLADSIATRQDLERLMGVDPARITVVYPGVGEQFRPMSAAELAPARAALGLPERFMLFVSTIEPRKNLPRLIEAYALLRDRIGMPLVLAGRRGWLYESVFQAIERFRLGNDIILLDYVDDKLLPSLYNLAWAFVYPSIYEGFGIPALEALACGTPVLTATNSSLPEVVGDAAVLVEADQIQSIADGLERIVHDQALRDRLRSAGPQRARAFTWGQAAEGVLERYNAVAAAPPLRR